jgi:rhomboid protease GluP
MLGAKYTYAIVNQGQVWRLIIPIILHNGFWHALMNGVSMLMSAFRLENAMGKTEYGLLIIFGGIYGNLLSSIMNPTDFGVGASTSLFAVIGGLCIQFWATFQV